MKPGRFYHAREGGAVVADDNKLNPNQQIFCDEYLIDRNATRAYRKAYPNVKSDDVAKAAGSRLLANVNVSAYLDDQKEQMHRDTIASAAEIREFFTAVMRGHEPDHVPVFVAKGVQELAESPPAMGLRLRAAELLGKTTGLFDNQQSGTDASGVLASILQAVKDID